MVAPLTPRLKAKPRAGRSLRVLDAGEAEQDRGVRRTPWHAEFPPRCSRAPPRAATQPMLPVPRRHRVRRRCTAQGATVLVGAPTMPPSRGAQQTASSARRPPLPGVRCSSAQAHARRLPASARDRARGARRPRPAQSAHQPRQLCFPRLVPRGEGPRRAKNWATTRAAAARRPPPRTPLEASPRTQATRPACAAQRAPQ